MNTKRLLLKFMVFICVLIFDIEVNLARRNGQEKESGTRGKLYWIREYNQFDERINKGSNFKLKQDANATDDFMSSTKGLKLSDDIEYLNQQVDEIHRTCNCSQMWNHLNILQTQIRHLAVAMTSMQVFICLFYFC